ncbi:hypothetical protein AAFF_G00051970 [Aldrovandia affinis]|uniref:Uncharacterized protein n=1 Tax=Aldrovandia affinis TaxID=143900 RepID=A0AAD7WYX4_9TELE|nr:hypothetical protein AAFF_G00051970 [Aldrovandia affinis]
MSRLDYIFVGGGISGMSCVLLPSWASDYDMLQAQLRELEEGKRPTAYFFQASRARQGASAIAGLRRADGTLAEGPPMLAVAESYYAELFIRRACDPAAEAYLLDCVSAQLGGEEAWSMEADVTLEEVREVLLSLRDGRAPGHDGLPKDHFLVPPERASLYSCTRAVTGQSWETGGRSPC